MQKELKRQSWTISLPDVHPSLNVWTRMHFRQRNDLKKQWENDTYYAAKMVGLPLLDAPIEIFINYYHPRTNVDLDNYTPKFIIDGLKAFFKDDSFKYVRKLGWTFIKSRDKRSEIVIKLHNEII